MEICYYDLLLSLIFWISVSVVIIIMAVCFGTLILEYKKKIIIINLSHEEQMKEKEWERKVKWEQMIKEKPKTPEDLKEALDKKDKEIAELKEQFKKSTQQNIERMAFLIHSLSNSKDSLTPDKVIKSVEQLKEIQEAIKKYLNLQS